MSTDSIYASRPWQRHYDYWVRPHTTYPGRPLSDILSATALVAYLWHPPVIRERRRDSRNEPSGGRTS